MSGPRGNRPTPPMVVYDPLGQELGVGDLVLFTRKPDEMTAIIVEIRPLLDPRSKEHTVQLTLTATFPVITSRGGRVPKVWRMQTQAQTGWTPEGQRDPDKDKEQVIGEGSIIIP